MILALCAPVITRAASVSPGWKNGLANLTGFVGGAGLETDITNPIAAVIAMALALIGMIFLVLTIYAGFLWLTARGDSGQVETAQKILKAAVIGLILVTAAYSITYYVTKITLGGESGGNEDNGKSAYCAEQGGQCIGVDDNCLGGTIISGFTDCRCCIKDSPDSKLPGPNECWYEGDPGCPTPSN